MTYTIKKVAQLSGVSVRTLHFYDEIRLPSLPVTRQMATGSMRRRSYSGCSRSGFPHADQGILGRPDFEQRAAVRRHRKVLAESLARARRLLDMIANTTRPELGERRMLLPLGETAFVPRLITHEWVAD